MVNPTDSFISTNSVSAEVPACPVCGEPCSQTLFRYTAEQAAAHFCPLSRDPVRYERLRQCIQRLWQDDASRIMQCGKCGFAFGWPFVAGDEEFYGILHEQMGYPAWKWDYEVACTDLLSRFDRGGKILDVGAGTGLFLQHLDSAWEKHAVEGSETTRGILREAGINVHPSLQEVQQVQGDTFDLITIFQVLEHVADFRATLASCRILLKPGGRLLITVPDGDAMIRQEKLTGCPDMPPNHINKWTPVSLALALQQAGLEPDARPLPEPSSWRNVAKHLHYKVIAEAAQGGTLAAQAYRIKRKPLRTPFLAVVGGIAMFKLIGHWNQLVLGGAFAQTAIRPI